MTAMEEVFWFMACKVCDPPCRCRGPGACLWPVSCKETDIGLDMAGLCWLDPVALPNLTSPDPENQSLPGHCGAHFLLSFTLFLFLTFFDTCVDRTSRWTLLTSRSLSVSFYPSLSLSLLGDQVLSHTYLLAHRETRESSGKQANVHFV